MKTAMGNTIEILKTETFEDDAIIVSKYGQGCNYETGKCVDGYQVDFTVSAIKPDGTTKNFYVVLQSLDRTDNMRAYSSSEMSFAHIYGCDADESGELFEFCEYDKEIRKYLDDEAEELCRTWFLSQTKEED